MPLEKLRDLLMFFAGSESMVSILAFVRGHFFYTVNASSLGAFHSFSLDEIAALPFGQSTRRTAPHPSFLSGVKQKNKDSTGF